MNEKRHSIFKTTLELYNKAKTSRPTDTHKFIAGLAEQRKLLRCYSQNIDMLEEKANLLQGYEFDKEAKCILMHGSLHKLKCNKCSAVYDWEGFEAAIQQSQDLYCSKCSQGRPGVEKELTVGGKLRPDFVMIDEESSAEVDGCIKTDAAKNPDVLLVIGTSLKLPRPKQLVKDLGKRVQTSGGKVIHINPRKPLAEVPSDCWISKKSDEWVDDLKKRMGADGPQAS